MGVDVFDDWDLRGGVVLVTCNSRGGVLQRHYPPPCPGEITFLCDWSMHNMKVSAI